MGLKGGVMKGHVIRGNLGIIKGKIKQQWGRLTENDLREAEGRKDVLVGKLQKKYGHSREEAVTMVEKFEKDIG